MLHLMYVCLLVNHELKVRLRLSWTAGPGTWLQTQALSAATQHLPVQCLVRLPLQPRHTLCV